MIYFFKDGEWTAISNSSLKWYEKKGWGMCPKLEINLPPMPSFGWEYSPDRAYKLKKFSQDEFRKYLTENRKVYELMLIRIDQALKDMEEMKHDDHDTTAESE